MCKFSIGELVLRDGVWYQSTGIPGRGEMKLRPLVKFGGPKKIYSELLGKELYIQDYITYQVPTSVNAGKPEPLIINYFNGKVGIQVNLKRRGKHEERF